MGDSGIWSHTDNDIDTTLASARTRVANATYTEGTFDIRANEFRALLVETARLMAWFAGSWGDTDGVTTLSIDPIEGAMAERVAVAGRLYATCDVFRQCDGGGIAATGITTAAPVETETAALPALAIVAIVVVGAAAVGYCAHQAGYVVDRQLARREDSQRLLQQHVAVMDVLTAHAEREDEAGKSIPLNAAEAAALESLKDAQTKVLENKEDPYEPFVPRPVATGSGWAIGSTPLIIGGVVLALLLLRSK